MTLLQHYQLSLLLIGISSILVSLWVLFQKGNKKTTRLFLIYSAIISFWGFCQAQAGITASTDVSLFWIRIMFLALIPAPIVLTYFFAATLKEKPPKIPLMGWLLLVGFMPFLFSDNFLRAGGSVGFLLSFPRAAPIFVLFNLIWSGWVVYALSHLVKKAVNKADPKSEQAKFLLFWFSFGYATGCVNYLYLYGTCLEPLQPFASYGVPISWAALGYGIFAYRIFDARLVIRKSLIYSLLVTSLTVGYFGLVYVTEKLFRNSVGYQSLGFSLSAFALMAVFFQPVKIAIQKIVDWLVFGSSQEALVNKLERLEEQALQTEKFKAVSTLAAGMAHEIKNPLTAIQTFVEFLPEKHRDPNFVAQCHQILTQETQRIQEIVRDVLDFAKPRAPQPKPVNLSQLIDSTVNLLSGQLLKRNVKWTMDYQHNGATFHADPDQLRQVLINLVQNAADAMPNGGELKIATQAVNSHIELTVSDTGHGIPPALLPKIFDPFVSTKQDGNGLGLAMVYSIIQAHRGSIRADSPGRLPANGSMAGGTTFTVSLPL